LATIVLDRSSGAILNTSGTLSSIRSTTGSSQSVSTAVPDDASSGPKDQNGIEEMAAMVWNYVNATKDLVQGLDAQARMPSHDQGITVDGDYRTKLNYYDYELKGTSWSLYPILNIYSLSCTRHLRRERSTPVTIRRMIPRHVQALYLNLQEDLWRSEISDSMKPVPYLGSIPMAKSVLYADLTVLYKYGGVPSVCMK
jgi:hypothetical protein